MPLSTPLHPLSQAGAWNRDGSNVAGPSNKIFETPRRPRHMPSTQRLTPKRLQPPKSPEKMRQSAMLPGFENAFMPSSPVAKTQIQSNGKGKQKAIDLLKDDSDGVVERDGLDLWERADAVIPPFPLARAARSEAGDMDVDIQSARPTEALFDVPMSDEVAADVPSVVEERLDDVKPFDWSAEVGTCSVDFSSAHAEPRLAVKDCVYTYGYLVNSTDLAGPDGGQFPSDTGESIRRSLSRCLRRCSSFASNQHRLYGIS